MSIMIALSGRNIKYSPTVPLTVKDTVNTKAIPKFVKTVLPESYAQVQRTILKP